MKRYYSDHYVIINWNSKGQQILSQITSTELKQKRDVVVILTCSCKDHRLQNDGTISYIENAKIEVDTLNTACVKTASSVIILADETKDPDTADAHTILAILAVFKVNEESKRRLSLVVEICNPKNVEIAKSLQNSKSIFIEVISASLLGANLLSQAAVNCGITALYTDLITFEKGTNEVYVKAIPEELAGKPFSHICRLAAERRGEKDAVIPIGIKRGDNVILNPLISKHCLLQIEDSIFAISDNVESLDKLLTAAVKAMA